MPRQQTFDEGHRPRLQRLRQQRMIGVSEYPGGDRPALGPTEIVFVDEQTHELRDRQRGMRVVQLNGDRFGQRLERSAFAEMARENVLQTRAHEEVLLLQAQLPALWSRVVRV